MRNGGRHNAFPWWMLFMIVLAVTACGNHTGAIEASGTMEAVTVNVSARTSGNMFRVLVEEGARVRKGDVLARVNDTVLKLQRDQARAQLVQAEQHDKVAREDAERTRALFRSGSVTQKQRDDADARADVARAQVDQARIAVSLCEEQLGYATVTAPVDGVITHKLVEEGELVFPGSALFSISDLSRMHLTIYLSERELARIKIGQPASISIDAFAERTFPGRVVFISPQSEFTPKNIQSKEDRVKLVFAVKIDVPNPEEILKPGLPADAVLDAIAEAGQ